jgi:hypothetical protein
MKFVSDIRLLLTGLWFGAAVFFIFVAQTAFSVLPERELAGAMVNRTLAILNYSGLAISIILLVTSIVGQAIVNKVWLWIERVLLLLMAVATAVGQFVIGWWLVLLRNEMGKPIDQVAVDDPLRIQFNQMHEYSVWVLMTAMVAALLVFFIIANRRFTAPKKNNVADFDFQKEFKI